MALATLTMTGEERKSVALEYCGVRGDPSGPMG